MSTDSRRRRRGGGLLYNMLTLFCVDTLLRLLYQHEPLFLRHLRSNLRRFLWRSCKSRVPHSFLHAASKFSILHLPQRTTFGRCRMQERAKLLVLGPVRALTILGTISAHLATLTAAAADQEPRLGESSTLATVFADPAPQPWPDLSQMWPVRHGTHNPCWSPYACMAQRCVGGVYKLI